MQENSIIVIRFILKNLRIQKLKKKYILSLICNKQSLIVINKKSRVVNSTLL